MITMPGTKRAVLTGIAAVMLCGLTSCRYRSPACKERGIAFSARVDALHRVALDKLKIGTKKADVIQFFAEHKFPISFDEFGANGTVYTTGCSPAVCGTDAAVIDLEVKLDEAGNVKSKPVVIGFYTNCP